MARIDLSLFDISTIEAKHKARKCQTHTHGDKIARECDRPACDEVAYYKAPKSPRLLNEYRYFCLKHIREHNERWNYCENMTEQEIISHLEKDVVGHRPTWQSGMSNSNTRDSQKTYQPHYDKPFAFDDPFDLTKNMFDTAQQQQTQKKSYKQKQNVHYDDKSQKIYDACHVMAVEFPPLFESLRHNYKKLVKQYHPDTNKTDKDAEQKLRSVVEAYKILTDFLGK